MNRFEDQNLELGDFTDKILVLCPNCSNPAYVLAKDNQPRLVCHHCGYNRQRKSDDHISQLYGVPQDPYFNESLYLVSQCCGEILFAYNAAHLQYLKDYVSSGLRERNKTNPQMKNRSLISRLPQWIKNRNNRTEILNKIQQLEKRLANLLPHS
ncbi:MAG: hypothetical protein MJB14_19595 [Spirochaetes bacterium]|nr:hypothetical protein [Spirochaetota bacterium]